MSSLIAGHARWTKPSDNNNDDNNDTLTVNFSIAVRDCPMLVYVVRACEFLLYKYECLPSRLLSVV
jgi:hypothetical protein